MTLPAPGEPGSEENPFPAPPLPPGWEPGDPDAIAPGWEPGDPVAESTPAP
jgi:hypothetical protein